METAEQQVSNNTRGACQPVESELPENNESSGSSKQRNKMFSVDFAKSCGYPEVLDQLMSRIIHACYSDSWALRISSFHAVRVLRSKLPLDYLCLWLPAILRAFFMVMRCLPDHCGDLILELQETMEALVKQCLLLELDYSDDSKMFPQEKLFFQKYNILTYFHDIT